MEVTGLPGLSLSKRGLDPSVNPDFALALLLELLVGSRLAAESPL